MSGKKRYYAVMKLVRTILVNEVEQSFPAGEYIIPVYADRKKADENSDNGRYPVVEVESTEVENEADNS